MKLYIKKLVSHCSTKITRLKVTAQCEYINTGILIRMPRVTLTHVKPGVVHKAVEELLQYRPGKGTTSIFLCIFTQTITSTGSIVLYKHVYCRYE